MKGISLWISAALQQRAPKAIGEPAPPRGKVVKIRVSGRMRGKLPPTRAFDALRPDASVGSLPKNHICRWLNWQLMLNGMRRVSMSPQDMFPNSSGNK